MSQGKDRVIYLLDKLFIYLLDKLLLRISNLFIV